MGAFNNAAVNLLLVVVLFLEIVRAILAQGYTLRPLHCWPNLFSPTRCVMALHSSGNWMYGWLDIYVQENGEIEIIECNEQACPQREV